MNSSIIRRSRSGIKKRRDRSVERDIEYKEHEKRNRALLVKERVHPFVFSQWEPEGFPEGAPEFDDVTLETPTAENFDRLYKVTHDMED